MNVKHSSHASFREVSLRYGVPCGLILIFLTLVFYLSGIDKDNYSGFISIGAMFLICLWAVSEVRKKSNGSISFRDGFKTGVTTLGISGLLSLKYYYIHITLIDKNFLTDLVQKKVDEMQRKGMDEASIDQAMKYMEFMNSPGITVLLGSVNIIISGLFFSMIVAAIMKKEPKN
jgi:hypothetical protein